MFYCGNSRRALRELLSIFLQKKRFFPRDLLEIEGNPGYQLKKNDSIKCVLLRLNLITILKTHYDMMNLVLEFLQKDYSGK